MNGQDIAMKRPPLQAARRTVSATALVAAGEIAGGQTCLRTFTPALPSVDLPGWFDAHRSEV